MRLVSVLDDDRMQVALMDTDRLLPLAGAGLATMRDVAAAGAEALQRIRHFTEEQPASAWRDLNREALGPAVPDPGAVYTIGLNYRSPGEEPSAGPDRPLVYGKAGSSVSGDRSQLTWDRRLTASVDPECELGVVIGEPAFGASPEDAMQHIFGYTVMNDVSSRDPWLDGDQWLIGKSMPGFCPVGPWIVTRDALDTRDLRLGCRINGVAIQEGRTSQMRFDIPVAIAYLSRHVRLMPGDLIATGTPARLGGPMGPGRHLEPGDEVVAWIEGIGELTTYVE